MAKKIADREAFIRYGDLRIPVSVYFERRRNTRISIGSASIHLRLPGNLSKKEFSDQVVWAKKWLHRRFEKAPALLERFRLVTFQNYDRIQVMNDTYVIHLAESDRKSVRASLEGRDISIVLPKDMEFDEWNKAVLNVLHKLMCQRYQRDIEKRVATLNERHFGYDYSQVKLKYIHSKWGSCSSEGDIVLSSKLLLCPRWIRDYVIVHELAHLRELNHSDAFWEIVASAIPDYKKADKWLNESGAGMELKPVQQPVPTAKSLDMSYPERKTTRTTSNKEKTSDPQDPTPPAVRKTRIADKHPTKKSAEDKPSSGQLSLF